MGVPLAGSLVMYDYMMIHIPADWKIDGRWGAYGGESPRPLIGRVSLHVVSALFLPLGGNEVLITCGRSINVKATVATAAAAAAAAAALLAVRLAR